MDFQGQHTNKLYITHKAEEYLFKCYALTYYSYTSIYFYGTIKLLKNLEMGISPLYDRVISIFIILIIRV